MTVSDFLERRRLTQDDFARSIGVNRSFVSQLASGKKRPSPEIAKKIEAATDGEVSAASLLGVAELGGEAIQIAPGRWVVRPGANGEVTLPARLLAEMGFRMGETLALRAGDGQAVVTSTRSDLQRAQAYVAKHARKGGSVVEELVAERRIEAARE